MAEVEIGIGKSGRRAYGFDDIAIVPSRRTRDPEDVDISWEIDAFRFELPLMAAAMDGVVSPGDRDRDRPARRPRRAQPRRPLDPLRGSRAALRGDRRARRREGDAAHAGDLRRADQARADRASASARSRQAASPSCASLTPQRVEQFAEAIARGRARPPRHPGHGRVRRARVEDRRAAQPQEVHPRVRHPGDRRRLRVVPGRAAPHAHRRGRRPRRRRARARVHDPRRARHRRAAGHRDRRRRGRPHPPPRRDRRVRARHRRRRHAHRRRHRQGDRLRRRRGDDRLAARRARTRRRAGLPLGHGDVPPHAAARRACEDAVRRHARRRSSSAPRTRTTARSTSSARCARRWPRPATRRSRSSRRPRSWSPRRCRPRASRSSGRRASAWAR